MLLQSDIFKHLRLYWFDYLEKELHAILLVPEYEMMVDEDAPSIAAMEFREERLTPLIRLCERIWSELPVYMVQSSLENGGAASLSQIAEGCAPQAWPFAIVPADLADKVRAVSPEVESSLMANNGVLLVDRRMF
ncbi:hypothetical protein QWJ34_12185 [Saccharibacillus sp. CPCC 101409]|uniref:hypothetical protein n=1 Tax=Saccharibacillus sp. CPCC 101409 TaxID=3058041 RepID=UPI002673BB05|nr:hypothetical protein [Saccharibacillus sp. CPCC 101409]MDO3410521.1 hypothetical protein [Saccharibacillus sp. CPCC 101409]